MKTLTNLYEDLKTKN